MTKTMERPSKQPVNLDYWPRGTARELIFRIQDPEVLISGPAGTGKSLACLWKLHYHALNHPNLRALILRKTRESLTDSALVTFERDVLPEYFFRWVGATTRASRHSYVYPNGAEIVVGGLRQSSRDVSQKIMSTEYDLIYVQEAIELSEDDWERLTTRLRNNKIPFQQLMADTNPDRPTHWLRKRCMTGKTRLIESRHEDNPTLWDRRAKQWTVAGTAYIAKLDALTGPRRERLRFGRWVQAEGVVYEEWDAAIHVVDPFPIPHNWPRYWAVDFGYTDPFVCQWFAEDPEGRLHLYRELVQTHLLVEDAAGLISKMSEGEPRPRFIVCDHDREGRETLMRHLDMDTDPAIKDMENGIQAVSLRLRKAPDGKPRLFVHRDALAFRDPRMEDTGAPCGFEEEVDGYVWNMKDGRIKGEEPVDKDNHSADALRYLVEYLDAPTAKLELGIFDLSPKREETSMSYPPRYPQIRYFSQSSAWQPQPVIRGQMVMACPTFANQEEAAWFVLEMHRQLKLPLPAFNVPDLELRANLLPDAQTTLLEKQKTIRDAVLKMIAVHQLVAEKVEAVLPPEPARGR